jgi:Bifunctional DNA primase/polymerase, N-terminal
MSNAALEEALAYAAERAWPIFPCTARKIPLFKGWQDAACSDPGTIESWWKRWPDARIGLTTGKRSGLVVLDVDLKDPRAYGLDSLADLGFAILPEVPIAHTRSGGFHLYFKRGSIAIRNSIGELGPGLDVRGDAGLIVLPSSNSGYWWDPHWNFDSCTPLPAPDWLNHRRRRETARAPSDTRQRFFDPETVLDEACRNIRSAGPGEKWRTIRKESFIAAGLARDRHLPESRVRHEIEAAILSLKSQCEDFDHAVKGYEGAFAEGLAASRRAK